ncbi:MAG: hypothetical protein KIS66_02310 [Fimbriimonadaceae bacterium]|nr:hypothetical protein [Fimbriimonadaceae bacterium]
MHVGESPTKVRLAFGAVLELDVGADREEIGERNLGLYSVRAEEGGEHEESVSGFLSVLLGARENRFKRGRWYGVHLAS